MLKLSPIEVNCPMLERTVANIENILNIVDGVADCYFNVLLMVMIAIVINVHWRPL